MQARQQTQSAQPNAAKLRFQWLDEDDESDEEDQPLLRGAPREAAAHTSRLFPALAIGALLGFFIRYVIGPFTAPAPLVETESALLPLEAAAAQATNPPWTLMIGVLSRELKGWARRQRV